jgi:hypothetical protein
MPSKAIVSIEECFLEGASYSIDAALLFLSGRDVPYHLICSEQIKNYYQGYLISI